METLYFIGNDGSHRQFRGQTKEVVQKLLAELNVKGAFVPKEAFERTLPTI